MITIPCYDLVIVPGVTYYFQQEMVEKVIGREPGKGEEVLFLILREDIEKENMKPEDFYPIGVRGIVDGRNQDNNTGIKTLNRIRIRQIVISGGEFQVEFEEQADVEDQDTAVQKEELKNIKEELIHFANGYQWGIMARNYILHWNSLEEIAASLSYQLSISNEEKYQITAADEISRRHGLIVNALHVTIEVAQIGTEARKAQTQSNEKIYREEAIKKQIRILQDELDQMHPENVTDIRRFELQIEQSGMNETAKAEAEKILNRMKQEGKDSHEYGMLYDYLDFVTGLSWKKEKPVKIDLKKAEKILNQDHYGLRKVKERILQQIAVMALNKKQSGSILLFVGAPGTGKTSIGQSIARALGREYARISLGGIRDEAEIRGHRRTYVGAMPGRIMEGIKRSGKSNPVVVLDEVDKMASSYNGDPSSALLEVLDPEQNSTFTDHYMNVPYDLSDVFFICTANTTDTIPEPLLNRMEVISFQGYTESEKLQIAKKHLLPKAMENMGIPKDELKISDKALQGMISDYTMEAGVRGLKKVIDTVCRAAAVKLVSGDSAQISVRAGNLKEFIDQRPLCHDRIKKTAKAGIVTGLAWTQAGGDILFIETMFTRGKGNVIITGQLGDVMKESVQIAISLVKSLFPEKTELFEQNDLHIHVPAGAVPKDGPSAGITLVTALASLIGGHPVKPEYAMTGEVSLRGDVMMIGGLPEKLGAAVRAGVKKVFIPDGNVEDLEDVPEEVREKLEIVPVESVMDVLKAVGAV
ncbi:MAG: endopeptidase La [Lachnospiraceae bacterium]|nr:endopeptidase La [Lachnospiraceae bacterium]